MDDFYKHPEMKDGYLNSCKLCRRKYMANRPKERIAEIDRKRRIKPGRREAARRYAKKAREKYPERRLGYNRKSREKYPEKYKARTIVGNYLRDGKLTKHPCCECGETEGVHAHHEDYSRPLDIEWLCEKHHADRHWSIRKDES